MGFNLLQQEAEIVSLNLRKENHNDEQVIAADIDIKATVKCISLLSLVADNSSITTSFWNSEGLPIFHNIKNIKPEAMFEEHEIRFIDSKGEERLLKDIKLKKFSFTPEAGRTAELRFQAQVTLESDHQVSDLSDYYRDGVVQIEVNPIMGELDLAS